MKKILKNGLASIALIVALVSPAQATLIDLELSLVIDVSGSVDNGEYDLQMDGYASAFRDASVIQNIENSINGIAVNALFFADNFYTSTLDSFTILNTAADALAFADILDNFVRVGTGGTNIYTGVNKAIDLLLSNGLDATVATVIDVSGDGTDNVTLNQTARDRAVGLGYTVNGIAIGGSSITNFYRDNVIGGTNSFVIEATSFADFETGIVEKLKRETITIPVPEPSTLLIFLSGIAFLFARRMK